MTRVVLIFFFVLAVSYIHADDTPCRANESSNICGRICEPSCSNRNPKNCPRIQCSKSTRGCRCNQNFYRNNKTRKCVLANDCPGKRDKRSPDQSKLVCDDNEQLGNCGRMCEKTCNNRNVTSCSTTNCSDKGCQCKEGYSRNEETDVCIPTFSCPKIRTRRASKKIRKCKTGEVMDPCGKKCEATCEVPLKPKTCSDICDGEECTCDHTKGYVRNTKTGTCVRSKWCPSKAVE